MMLVGEVDTGGALRSAPTCGFVICPDTNDDARPLKVEGEEASWPSCVGANMVRCRSRIIPTAVKLTVHLGFN
jgi:hypothetical protein